MNIGFRFFLLAAFLFFIFDKNFQIKCEEFFDNSDIITQNITFVSQTLRFYPGSTPFFDIAPLLLSLVGIDYLKNVPGVQLVNHFKCSMLPLDKTQKYSVIKPLSTIPNQIMDFTDLKLPFTNILAQYISFYGKKYCIAFNKYNYGFGFDVLTSIPCMSDKKCGASLYAFPTKEPAINNNQAIFFPFDTTSDGFSYKLSTNLNIYASFHHDNFFYFRTSEFDMDLFYNAGHLFSLRILQTSVTTSFSVSGALRDSVSNVMNTCYPSGIFVNARIETDYSLKIFSIELAGLLGKNMLNLEGNVDAGYYIDFRKSQKNGFFLRSDVRIDLFHMFKLKIYLEVTKINQIELKRRIDSMKSSSLCPDYEITVVTKYLFDKFNYAATSKNQLYNPYKMKNAKEWERFISFGSQPTTFYFVGYLKAKAVIKFPLVPDILGIQGYLEGFYVFPNPFKRGLKLHMELEIEATLYGFGIDLRWEVDDQETKWYCFVELFLVDIGFVLKGPSTWLEEKGYGSLLSIPKHFEKFSIRWGNSLKKLIQKINEMLKKIAERLKEMWNSIARAVENLHREIKKLTDKICNCFVSDIAAGLLTVISSGFVAAAQLILNIFGNTKTETRKIGETDPFKCDILEVKVKKCICAFGGCWCDTIRTERTVDQNCIKRVQAIHLEAAAKEELANWKEEVVTVNMAENLGYQYILEQIEKNNLDFFTSEDIFLSDIIYEMPSLRDHGHSFQNKFDPNNQSFVSEFENTFTSLFPEMNNIDEDLDLSQLYFNSQDLLIKTQLVVNTTRLSSVFKGKDMEVVNFSLPIEIDFNKGDLLEQSFDRIIETLSDPNGTLFRTIVGNNTGITDILLQAYGMTPPIISIISKTNKTIYCDDPQIDEIYDKGEDQIIERLKFFLTSIVLEDVYQTCKSNIIFIDNVECTKDENICGARNCLFERYILDGCSQKSNTVYENIKILPRKPFFIEFPDNLPVKCDENVNVSLALNRFKQPKVNPGCRGLDYSLYYKDVRDERKCEQKIYRKWFTEIFDCEKELFDERVQQLYVNDKEAPFFSYFPPDKNVEFFEAYGTNKLDFPRAYDSCGHGPSLITYNDTAKKTADGKRLIERTWKAVDSCGNKREKIQNIYIKNSVDKPKDFRNFLTFSFGQINLTNALIMGETSSKEEIKLNNSQIGDLNEKCANLKFMLSSSAQITIDDSIINGPIKTLNHLINDFNFDESWEEAKKFSKFLNNSILQTNIGLNRIKCMEHTQNLEKEYPIINFKNSACIGHDTKKLYTNIIKDDDDLVLDHLNRVVLKGNELIYNIFYIRDIALISNKVLAIDVPKDSFAIINLHEYQIKSLNLSKIEFVSEKINFKNIIFNFLNADEIFFNNNDLANIIVGSILAPYASFEINGGDLFGKNKILSGQLFVRNLNAISFYQQCELFEPFI